MGTPNAYRDTLHEVFSAAGLDRRGDLSVAQEELYALAGHVDSARVDLGDSLRSVSRSFVELAEQVDRGRCYASNPMASSRVYNLPMQVADLHRSMEVFRAFARAQLSREQFEAFNRAVAEKLAGEVLP